MQEFFNEVSVRVWRNVKTLGNVPTGHFGHASVELRAPWIRKNEAKGVMDERMLISYWPKGSASLGNAFRSQKSSTNAENIDDKISEMSVFTALRLEVAYREKNPKEFPDGAPKEWHQLLAANKTTALANPRPGQKPTQYSFDGTADGLPADSPLWSQSPDTKIRLPALIESGRFWGVPFVPIMTWWEKFRSDDHRYRALSTERNCAGIALMALKEGGCEGFLSLPTLFFYAEPMQVEKYARGLRSVIEQMEIGTANLKVEVNAARSKNVILPSGPSVSDGLWTPNEWKSRSALGTFQTRSSAMRDIDSALLDYHSATWAANYRKKFASFVKLFRAIMVHRAAKADSARSAAVLTLASQALAVLEGNGPIKC